MTDEKLAPAPDSPPFHTRYGFTRVAGARLSTSQSPPQQFGGTALPGTHSDPPVLVIRPYPELCHRGLLRPTVLASAVDLVSSLFVRELVGTDVTFTSDLSLRAPSSALPGEIEVRGELLRAGSRTVTTGVTLSTTTIAGADREFFAYGETTFTRMARNLRPEESPPSIDSLRVPDTIDSNPLTRPLAAEVGIEVVDAPKGSIRLLLRDDLLNPEGVLQGALVALLIEVAALAAADAYPEMPPQTLVELDLRYLSAAKVGPIVGQATQFSSMAPRLMRVMLHDRGQKDRIIASALVQLGDAPLV